MSTPSREQLIHWLTEAAEIEHQLMCCYLYAAFSLKRHDPQWSDEQAAAVERWRRVIVGVALEEMAHLCLVCNLSSALGAHAHFDRPAMPVDCGAYPAGFVIRLQPFSEATIEHFMYLERPSDVSVKDGEGFDVPVPYQRAVPQERLSPGSHDYDTVGQLYETLSRSLSAGAAAIGERALFIGDPRLQIDAALAPLPGVAPILDLSSAQAALHTIVAQGEGAGTSTEDSHFARFANLLEELRAMQRAEPSFNPAWPAATNPVMNIPVKEATDRVHISHPGVARWLDIGNALYTTSLRCLLQGFGETDRNTKAVWLNTSFALMRALAPVGQGLAARPARADAAQPHAGLTFTPLRGLSVLPRERAARVISERLVQLRERAAELPHLPIEGECESTWDSVIATLGQQRKRLDEIWASSRQLAPKQAEPPSAPVPIPPVGEDEAAHESAHARPQPDDDLPNPVTHADNAVEHAVGDAVTIHFEARRCIHSRHCVLEAPRVFKANTPGAWMEPNAMTPEALVAVAHRCPSGAIRYTRHDGGLEEAVPPVNTVRMRENGPYAFHAPLTIAHADEGLRATLCRCGQSQRKPWCDGSHVAAEFQASGEPPGGIVDALAARDGPLQVIPLENGPLEVCGNLEICTGTGRTVARVTHARLCRCGRSRSKPFCDLSHVPGGFSAAGE